MNVKDKNYQAVLNSILWSLVCLCSCSYSSNKDASIGNKHSHDTVTFIFRQFPLLSDGKKFKSGSVWKSNSQNFLFKDEINTLNLNPKVTPENVQL